MTHAPGWIELYGLLEMGLEPSADLVALCKAGRTQHTRETMLHWYAIEGQPHVVQRMIDLGFDLDAVDAGGSSPLLSAAMLERWGMVRTLRRAGARVSGVTTCGESYRSQLCKAGSDVPPDLRGDAHDLEDLLLPGGPEKVPVAELFLTGSGPLTPARGSVLNRDSWSDFVRETPEFERGDLDEPTDLVYVGDEGSDGWCAFVASDDSASGAGVRVSSPSALGLRVAYKIAQHFGARVLWEFECGPGPRSDRA